MPNATKVFIAYSRKDQDILNEFRLHLTPLERSEKIEVWYDGKIEAGVVWEQAIKDHIHQADIILLLVSASAIASDYFYDNEVKDALERHEKGTARVIPFILRPCAWHATQLSKLQALPKDGKPVTTWADRDAAYSDGIDRILEILENIEREKKGIPLGKGILKNTIHKSDIQELSAKEFPQRKVSQKDHQGSNMAKFNSSPYLWVGLGLVLMLFSFVWWKSCNGASTNLVDKEEPLNVYRKKILIADSLFNEKNYEKAKDKFENAKTYAKTNKLNDTDALKGMEASIKQASIAKSESEKDNESSKANYDNKMEKAQSLFNEENYEESKKEFEAAKSYAVSKKLDTSQADEGIQACKKEIEDDIDELFNKAVDNGHQAFNKNYILKAKNYYEQAISYKKNTDIKNRISQCEKKLNDIIQNLEKNMVPISKGDFMMGCTKKQEDFCNKSEKPVHQVSIKAFKMNKYEVTREEWLAIMGEYLVPLPIKFKGCSRCPISNVTWNQVQDFIRKLNIKTDEKYRLPTEAEWEYAARDGDNLYSGSSGIDREAWYKNNASKGPREVGTKQKFSNGNGMYDMSGNVMEWCQDKWHDNYHGAPNNGEAWESGGVARRVVRGGSFEGSADWCRVSKRSMSGHAQSSPGLGFRLAL